MSFTTTSDQITAAAQRLAGDPAVVAVFLFGSTLAGHPHAHSDVDLGILVRSDVEDARPGSPLHLRLIALAAETLGERADIVILNGAPISVAFRAACRGHVLASNDERARVSFVARVADRYMDMAPFRRILTEGVFRRLREGTFGRP